LALVLYAITLGGTYIYDDSFLIGLDERVAHPKLWGQFWTHDYFNGAIDNLYRPLVSQSYGLQWWLHGNRPWAFHLVNLLLHAGVCALVAEFGRRLLDWRVGLIAGLLFAAHPLHAEAVAGVVGRAELACAVGVVGAMVLFLKRPMTTPRALSIFGLCLVAVLSKEQGMLMPALLAALLPVRRMLPAIDDELSLEQRHAERQAMLLMFGLVIWTVGGVIVLREEVLHLKFEWDRGFLDVAMQPMIHSPPLDRWLIPVALLGRYFQLLVVPLKLSIDYGLSVMGPTIGRNDPYLWLGAAVLAGWVAGFCISLVRRKWVVAFCLVAMALTYSMASNVVIIAAIFGERLMYLPSVFFVILVAMGMVRLRPRVWGVLLAILLVLGSIRTWTYVRRWNDRDAFYGYALREQPKSLKIHLLVAFADYEEGHLEKSRRVVDDAIFIYPDYWELWKMQGLIDMKAEDWNRAVADWQRAFDLHPAEPVNEQLVKAIQMRDKERATTRGGK
jgi:protein O-mannosyl-transferase